MAKKAAVIYGPPGSGKGTQANLLAWTKNFIHFDTGKYLEQVVHDPENQKDPMIKKERELFDSGILLTPEFVLKVTTEKTREISQAGYSIAFSGSPRTMFEAFGDEKNKGLIEILEGEYGKENVNFLFLKIDPEESIKRNANRLVCSVCGTAILYSDAAHKHKTCPLCGAELRKRTVDNPDVFKTRIKEYEERTKPIVAELKRRGYKIIEINGSPLPFEVFKEIRKNLNI
jgi:adenylate kinase